MDKEEKVALVKKVLETRDNMFKQFEKLEALVGRFDDKSPLWTALCDTSEMLLHTTSLAIDDPTSSYGSWLIWFVYDNDCGERAYNATVGSWNGPVKSVEDLIEVIEQDQPDMEN